MISYQYITRDTAGPGQTQSPGRFRLPDDWALSPNHVGATALGHVSKEEMGSWSEMDGRLVVVNSNNWRQDELRASTTITTKFERRIRLLIHERIGRG